MEAIMRFVFRVWSLLAVSFFAQPDPNTPQSGTGPYPAGTAVPGGPRVTVYDDGFASWPDSANPNETHVSRATIAVASGDGAITLKQGTVYITKGSAAALTLAPPTAGAVAAGGDDGKRLRIISQSAYAHVVTVTTPNKVNDGSSTTKDTLTFAAHVGALAELEAYNGSWNLVIGSTVAAAVATEV